MGWFNSIIQGIGSAVSWLTQNSASIAPAFNAVKDVAGLILSNDTNDPETPMGISDLFSLFSKASKYLTDVASKLAADTHAAALREFPSAAAASADTNHIEYPVLWSAPAPNDGQNNPSLALYQDVSKFLAEHDLPTTLTDVKDSPMSDEPRDLAGCLAQAFFSKRTQDTARRI